MHGTIETTFRVEWRPLAELRSHTAEWRTLAERTVEPNVFYEPSFALPAAAVFGGNVGAGLVWSRSTPNRLLGLFPARIELRRYGFAPPVLVGWTHPYAPLGSPLLEASCPEAVVDAWLDYLAGEARFPKLMLLPYLPLEGRVAHAFDAVIARRAGRSADFARHARALLAPCGERASYLERAIDRKKRKELRRQRHRLADDGSVNIELARNPSAAATALDEFFSLEARGWKGRAGTAARSSRHIARFMETAVLALAAEGKAQVVRLCVGSEAVAVIVTLRSGANAWCWKIAYDERHARCSPGVQILLDATQSLLGDADIARADSCATPDHPMIDHIWRERLHLADRLISPGPASASMFRLACTLEAARRAALQIAKAGRDFARRQ
ncbi:MAG TPA: GNAT family N-acetyltransferase [Xanthobacteraceae bacterium]